MARHHNKLIANAAEEALAPLNFRRKGRSRLWIADHGWWVAIVEFQPSSWSKGCYLNVAAHWLWTEKDHLSFDYGGRLGTYAEYQTDDQFGPELVHLAKLAAEEANRLAQAFISFEAAAERLSLEADALGERGKASWAAYHAGMALGLSGRMAEAKAQLCTISDERVLPAVARMLPSALDEQAFQLLAQAIINARRRTIGLLPA